MATGENTLVFAKREFLEDTNVYQVDDGTLFYHEYRHTPRLYVRWQGIGIEAKYLPEITVHGTHGNALFFESEGKIYKAHFDETNGITVSIVRDRLEDERIHVGTTLCSRVRDGREYVYRLDEDPHRDGIMVDVPRNLLNRMGLKGLHRRRLLYVCQSQQDRPMLSDLSPNAIVLELPTDPWETVLFARDSSPIIYAANCAAGILFTLDTNRNQFLPTLHFSKFCDIVSIRHGMITVTFSENGECHLMTAQLPTVNFETKIDSGHTVAEVVDAAVDERNRELMLQLAEKQQQNEELQATLDHTREELRKAQSTIADFKLEMYRTRREFCGAVEKRAEEARGMAEILGNAVMQQ